MVQKSQTLGKVTHIQVAQFPDLGGDISGLVWG